jgi:RNA polymerase sigma factor (sigma-70 family)
LSEESHNLNQLADHLFRHEAAKMVAVLARLFGVQHIEMAEDVVQEAFARALKEWTYKIPDKPASWLMQTAKNAAIDIIRKERYKKEFSKEAAALLKSEYTTESTVNRFFLEHEVADSQLRMIFACCHPSLSNEDQIALTLSACSSFDVSEVAASLLLGYDTAKKRLQRAKQQIKDEGIELEIPSGKELKPRMENVLKVIYLLFNEGYKSSSREEIIRKDLCAEAIRLCHLLSGNPLTAVPKVHALLALMHLQVSRFGARLDDVGDIILLEDQDRSKWDYDEISKGLEYLGMSAAGEELSEYHLQAAIAAEHAMAQNFESTNWKNIYSLYQTLSLLYSSPLVSLNKALVQARVSSAHTAIKSVLQIPELERHLASSYLFHAVLAQLYSEDGDLNSAIEHYQKAIDLVTSERERRLLRRKMEKLI